MEKLEQRPVPCVAGHRAPFEAEGTWVGCTWRARGVPAARLRCDLGGKGKVYLLGSGSRLVPRAAGHVSCFPGAAALVLHPFIVPPWHPH